jgi:hypothetical protein
MALVQIDIFLLNRENTFCGGSEHSGRHTFFSDGVAQRYVPGRKAGETARFEDQWLTDSIVMQVE